MKTELTKKLFLLTSCLVLLAFLPAAQTYSMSNDSVLNTKASSLKIATRHDATLYVKFEEAFLASDYAIDAGITVLEFVAPTTYSAFHKYMSDTSYGVSVGWGGGPTIFTNLALAGVLMEINEENTDAELMALIDEAVPETIAGADMKFYDGGDLFWIANAISSFGYTINLDYLTENGLPIPLTWEDLASPEFFKGEFQNTIAMGNAPQTTSNTRIYQIIIQKYGWEKGWEIITRMAGNGGIYGESIPTRTAVINKEVGVALTIDFYGLVAQTENDRCLYVVPENGSIVNGDPIVLAKEPANLPGAIAFMKFVNTQEGQTVWLDYAINRLPVRVDAFDTAFGQTRDDIFEVYNMTIHNQGIDFDEDFARSIENSFINYFEASITTPHVYLKREWANLVTNLETSVINETEFNAQAAILGKPDLNQSEAIEINDRIVDDSYFRNFKKSEWTALAKNRFGEAVTIPTYVEPEPTDGDPTDDTNGDDSAFNMVEIALIVIIPLAATSVRRYKNRKK